MEAPLLTVLTSGQRLRRLGRYRPRVACRLIHFAGRCTWLSHMSAWIPISRFESLLVSVSFGSLGIDTTLQKRAETCSPDLCAIMVRAHGTSRRSRCSCGVALLLLAQCRGRSQRSQKGSYVVMSWSGGFCFADVQSRHALSSASRQVLALLSFSSYNP